MICKSSALMLHLGNNKQNITGLLSSHFLIVDKSQFQLS